MLAAPESPPAPRPPWPPAPAALPPVLTSHPEATGGGGAPVGVGETLTCTSGGWEGSPTFAYRWLRNGAPIAGGESDEYEVTAADEGTAIECQVTATNAGGSVVGENLYPIVVSPEPSPYPPYTEYNPGPTIPAPPPPNETRGPVTIADELPAGLVLASASASLPAVSGEGWVVKLLALERDSRAWPRRHWRLGRLSRRSRFVSALVPTPPSGALRAGGSRTQPLSAVAERPRAVVTDPTSIAPAVPFGIQTLTTSVTDAAGAPMTQAGGHPVAATASFAFNLQVETSGAPGDGGWYAEGRRDRSAAGLCRRSSGSRTLSDHASSVSIGQ